MEAWPPYTLSHRKKKPLHRIQKFADGLHEPSLINWNKNNLIQLRGAVHSC